jgi:hypothetical protein
MPEPLKTKRLLLCEGVDDAQLLRALIAARNLGAYDVRWVKDVGGAPGNSGFKEALITVVALTNFRAIRHVCLIADCDDHYGDSFNKLAQQIVNANAHPDVGGRYYVPPKPYTTVGGMPLVTVAMIPAENKKGAIETLVVSAISELPKFSSALKCAEAALDCVGIRKGNGAWPKQKIDKATMIAALALFNRDDPGVTLSRLWVRQPDLIPLNCKSFDALATFIGGLKI